MTGFSNPVFQSRAPPFSWIYPETQGSNPTMFDPQYYREFSGHNTEDFTFSSLFNPASAITTSTNIAPAVITPLNSMPAVSLQISSVP